MTLPVGQRRALQERPERARCSYCERPAVSWDHVEPRARGGGSESDNLVPACRACNSTKGMLPLVVFLAVLANHRAMKKQGRGDGQPYPCERCGDWVYHPRPGRRAMNVRARRGSPRTPHVCWR